MILLTVLLYVFHNEHNDTLNTQILAMQTHKAHKEHNDRHNAHKDIMNTHGTFTITTQKSHN